MEQTPAPLFENPTPSNDAPFPISRDLSSDGQGPLKVQSFINNINFPTSLDELYFFALDHGRFNVEDILQEKITTWTSPTWAKIGDIVFFMHAKSARSIITRLRSELYCLQGSIPNEKYNLLIGWIRHGLELHARYGGKIFAIGRVCGAPEYIADDDDQYEDASLYHWRSKIYTDIEVDVLERPIDLSEFSSFIHVSRCGAITGVFGKEYLQLREIIQKSNQIPQYFAKSIASPLPLSRVNPQNWMQITSEYRRCFLLESQFRSYYVDYLLRELGDQKTFFKECRCIKRGIPNSFVDNVIRFNGKYLPVEVKLSVSSEADIKGQVSKYCYDDLVYLNSERTVSPEQMYQNVVLIIDTDNVYLFKADEDQIDILLALNELNNPSDILLLKDRIRSKI